LRNSIAILLSKIMLEVGNGILANRKKQSRMTGWIGLISGLHHLRRYRYLHKWLSQTGKKKFDLVDWKLEFRIFHAVCVCMCVYRSNWLNWLCRRKTYSTRTTTAAGTDFFYFTGSLRPRCCTIWFTLLLIVYIFGRSCELGRLVVCRFQLQLSAVLTAVRRYFEMLSSGYGTGTLTQLDFERHLRSFNLDAEERHRWFTMLDVTKDG